VPATKKTKIAKTTLQRPQNTVPKAVEGLRSDKLIGFAIEDRVSHPQFGNGTIVAIDGSTLSIAFDKQGTRRIIDSYVKPLKK
jgi:hypothetical protein